MDSGVEEPMKRPEDGGDADASVNIVDWGLEDLVAALLEQQPIEVPGGGDDFLLRDDNARRILAYYVANRQLWPRAKPVRRDEIEGVLKALDAPLPVTGPTRSAVRRPRTWRLTRVEAHRFAGLHRHCGPAGQDPGVFAFDLDRDVTLIRGFNGAGKTALQNVIVWCLTGLALRSQHMPEPIHEPMAVSWKGGRPVEQGGNEPALELPPVVPFPSAAELESLDEKAKVDTWARLKFVDSDADEVQLVQRRLTVGPRGKIGMDVTGLSELGLSDLAIEVGTLMPGIAAQMRFDERTTFATAVATLTGLKPLEDFGFRSERVVKRLRGDETITAQSAAAAKVRDFNRWRKSMREAWMAQPILGNPVGLLDPDDWENPREWSSLLADARTRLESMKATSEQNVESVLGRRLDNVANADALLEQLRGASDSLGGRALLGLPTMAVIRDLAAVTEDDITSARTLIREMVERARQVAKRLTRPDEAARWQLYARVAAWHAEHHGGTTIDDCPVCASSLAGVADDSILGLGVGEALTLCGDADWDIAKGVQEWLRDAARELRERLPQCFRSFADRAVPEGLLGLYRSAYVDELLADPSFAGPLEALPPSAARVWSMAVAAYPLQDGPTVESTVWPEPFGSSRLAQSSANVERVIGLVRQRRSNGEAIKNLLERYVGKTRPPDLDQYRGGAGRTNGEPIADSPLRDQIETLRQSVTNAAPTLALLRQLDELESLSKAYGEIQDRLARIAAAADAMAEFARFPDLVFHHVTGLIKALDQGTKAWLDKIYRPHYRGGPAYSGFDATQQKGIGLRAGVGDVEVDAYRIMNASQLRACVWAFVFSLWARVRARVGGIDCLLLDDPQDQFDPINAENLAAAIAEMPVHGMRPIVTSNNYRFLDAVRSKLPARSTADPSWYTGFISPISNSRQVASVGPDRGEVEELRRCWLADENDEDKARQFVIAVRVNLENRLWDLLAAGPFERQKPTLSDLIGALRMARKNGERPFEEPPFDALLSNPELRDSALFYRCINKAHHRPQEVTPHDAGEVDKAFNEVNRQLRSCSAAYARFMGRLTRDDEDFVFVNLPPAPAARAFRAGHVPVLGRVSARSSFDSLAGGLEASLFDFAELGPIACYGVRSQGLSPLVLQGQVVIVSLQENVVDGDPVVALSGSRTYLRRVFADSSDPSRVVLACDRSGTERVPPTLVLPRAKTRLLPVIGVVYEELNFPGPEEVVEVERSALLERGLVAAVVADDSAFPIMRAEDLVLLESVASLDLATVNQLEDSLVVAAAGTGSEVFAYLKRLGGRAGPDIRILENIGLKGHALSVAIGEKGLSADVAPLQRLWRVHGTIRRRA